MNEAGFIIKNHVFRRAECNRLIEELSSYSASGHAAGLRNLMSKAIVREIANDQRLIDIAESFSGTRLMPFKATLFAKTGKANWLVAWHQDTALPLERGINRDGWGPASVKKGVTFVHAPTWALSKIVALRVHLDASTEINGPLRVIPKSQKKRLLDDAEFHEWSRKSPVTCHVDRGGVIAMSPLLIHASSKCIADKPRRVLHIEYTETLELAPGFRLAIA